MLCVFQYGLAFDTQVVAQTVKNLPAMQESRIWSRGQEDLLESGMATHSSILAWKIPRTVHEVAKPDTTERLTFSLSAPLMLLKRQLQSLCLVLTLDFFEIPDSRAQPPGAFSPADSRCTPLPSSFSTLPAHFLSSVVTCLLALIYTPSGAIFSNISSSWFQSYFCF